MAGDLIRPKDLPPNSTINPNARIPADDGAKVYGPTLTEAVNQARPFASQAEAEGGTSATKSMNPLAVKQAIDAQVPPKISGAITALNLGTAAQSNVGDFATAAQGVLADAAVQPSDLAAVATSGDYNDLINKPSAVGVPAGGAAGQVLTKISMDDYDTAWQVPEPSITSVVTRSFVSSGTYTPTLGMLFCEIECFGGGGGGGGSIAATGTNITGAGGGGSGGYSRKWASAADIGVSKPVTVGAAGGGAAAGGNAGGSGSATSVGTLCVANGGSPGQGVTSLFSVGGAGGSTVGAVGDMVLPGNTGNTGSYSSINTSFPRVFGAPGADPPMGVGKGGIGQVQASGSTATGYSAGGGGGSDMGGTARAGGAGAQGIVIITEYIG